MTFDPDQALELVCLCEQAYNLCRELPCALPPGFDPPAPVLLGPVRPSLLSSDPLDVFGYVTRRAGVAYLVFRGTQVTSGVDRMQEWAEDFRALPMVPFGPGRVHRGFREIWSAVAPSVASLLKPGERLVITGHSLGAAIAVLARLQFGGDLMTFAGPRVGDPAIAAALWHDEAVRVINAPDAVPTIPTDPPFRHGGFEVRLDGPGSFFDRVTAHSLNSYRAGLENLRAKGATA